MFKPIGEKFIHCILKDTNMKHWVLVTELDVFLPNRKDIGSCSYDMEPTELTSFSIKVSRDKNQGRGYSELTIQAGCFQVLVTGGMYDSQDAILGGLLGSSIPSSSIHEYNTCYTLWQANEKRCFYRLLRDYSKPCAVYLAGFGSSVFAGHGFCGGFWRYATSFGCWNSLCKYWLFFIISSLTRFDSDSDRGCMTWLNIPEPNLNVFNDFGKF